MSEVRVRGLECQAWMEQERREELPCVRGKWWRLRGATPRLRSGAVGGRRHLESEVRGGGREELPRIRGQWRPGGDTSRQRPGTVTLRSHTKPEARGGSWKEPPMLKARPGGQEEQPEE